jgi:hypothetical protein
VGVGFADIVVVVAGGTVDGDKVGIGTEGEFAT